MIIKIIKSLAIIGISVYLLLWIFSFKTYNNVLGVSFSPEYARYLGLDASLTLDSIFSELKPSVIRLAVPWSMVENSQGVFDFSEVDSMVSKAAKNNAKVVLVLGQKVPRWPECYIPSWISKAEPEAREEALLKYVEETIYHYKNNPTIELWQSENEPFIRFDFGDCSNFNQSSIKKEIALIRQLDPTRKIVITDSGEMSSYRRPSFAGDILGTTLYRTIRLPGGMVFKYDWLPPAFYKVRARIWGNNTDEFFISELQAEPWFGGVVPKDRAGFDAEKSFDPKRFADNVEYAKKTGSSRTYLWGVEWWYFMKLQMGDDRYVETAKKLFKE